MTDHTIQFTLFTAWVFLSSQSISLTSGMFGIAKISSAIEARFQPFSCIRSSILLINNSLEKEVRAGSFPDQRLIIVPKPIYITSIAYTSRVQHEVMWSDSDQSC